MPFENLRSDVRSLLPGRSTEAGATRRTALQAALGLGYAAAAAPLMAQTAITTSADGLDVGTVHYGVNGFQVPAYRAAPAGKTGLSVVLVVQDTFGVHAYIADVCRRLAHAGYWAIAPALYARQGDPAPYTDIAQLMADVAAQVPTPRPWPTWTVPCSGPRRTGDAARVGTTGFCWGGRTTWLYAAHGPVKAGVAWYGRLVGSRSALAPRQPSDIAPVLRRRCWGCMAGRMGAFRLTRLIR